jgi:hypothetical protein
VSRRLATCAVRLSRHKGEIGSSTGLEQAFGFLAYGLMCVVMIYEMDLGLDWEDVTDIGELFSFLQASIARDTHLDDFNIENDTC